MLYPPVPPRKHRKTLTQANQILAAIDPVLSNPIREEDISYNITDKV